MPSPRPTPRWRPTRTSARSSSTCRHLVAHELDLPAEVLGDPGVELGRVGHAVLDRSHTALVAGQVDREVESDAVEHGGEVRLEVLVASHHVDRDLVLDRVLVPRAEAW